MGSGGSIAEAALTTGETPEEVWCAGGSGTLAAGLPRHGRVSRVHGLMWRCPWILARSATGSREADLGVFAKLFEDRLEWRLEAETFSRREIGGYDAASGHWRSSSAKRHKHRRTRWSWRACSAANRAGRKPCHYRK